MFIILEREEQREQKGGRGKETERLRHRCDGCFPFVPDVIESATFWCTGQGLNQLSHPDRAGHPFLPRFYTVTKIGCSRQEDTLEDK